MPIYPNQQLTETLEALSALYLEENPETAKYTLIEDEVRWAYRIQLINKLECNTFISWIQLNRKNKNEALL